MTKIPTPIVDKNGKQTTVHKKPEHISSKLKHLPSLPKEPQSSYVSLADGNEIRVPNEILKDFRGITIDDYEAQCFVVEVDMGKTKDYYVALTPCCNAHATADYDEDMDESYVLCKECFGEVGNMHAGRIENGEFTPVSD